MQKSSCVSSSFLLSMPSLSASFRGSARCFSSPPLSLSSSTLLFAPSSPNPSPSRLLSLPFSFSWLGFSSNSFSSRSRQTDSSSSSSLSSFPEVVESVGVSPKLGWRHIYRMTSTRGALFSTLSSLHTATDRDTSFMVESRQVIQHFLRSTVIEEETSSNLTSDGLSDDYRCVKLIISKDAYEKDSNLIFDWANIILKRRRLVKARQPKQSEIENDSSESNEMRDVDDNSSMMKREGIIVVDNTIFKELSQTMAPSGYMAQFSLPKSGRKLPKLSSTSHSSSSAAMPSPLSHFDWSLGGLILCHVQDPGNVGTILRSSVAFGIKQVLLLSSAWPWAHKVVTAASGAHIHLTLTHVTISSFIKEKSTEEQTDSKATSNKSINSAPMCALTVTGGMLPSELPPRSSSDQLSGRWLVVGNEGQGIDKQVLSLCSEQVTIETATSPPPASSSGLTVTMPALNAAVATSIALYALRRHSPNRPNKERDSSTSPSSSPLTRETQSKGSKNKGTISEENEETKPKSGKLKKSVKGRTNK